MQNPFRKLTPREMLAKQLDDAQRYKIEYSAKREEVEYSLQMLNARIARIQRELQAMTTPDNKEPIQ